MELTDQELANLVQVDGSYIDRDVLGVVEKIQRYDPNLRVQYLEVAASVGEPPYRVVERCRDGKDRVVLSAWQLDHTVYDQVVMHDTFSFDVLGRLDKINNKVRENQKKQFKESVEEANQYSHKILSTTKANYSVTDEATGEIVTFREDGTVSRRKRATKRNA